MIQIKHREKSPVKQNQQLPIAERLNRKTETTASGVRAQVVQLLQVHLRLRDARFSLLGQYGRHIRDLLLDFQLEAR